MRPSTLIALLTAAAPVLAIRQLSSQCPEQNCCAPEIVAPSEFYGLTGYNDTKTNNTANSVSRRNFFEVSYMESYRNASANRIDSLIVFRNVTCAGQNHWYPSVDFSYQPHLPTDRELRFSPSQVTVHAEQVVDDFIPSNITYETAMAFDYSWVGTFRLPGSKSPDFGTAQLIHIGQVACSSTLAFRFSIDAYVAGQVGYYFYPSCPTSGVGLRYGCCEYSADCVA